MPEPTTLIAGAGLGLQALGMLGNQKQPPQPLSTGAAQRRLSAQPTIQTPAPQPAQMMAPPENVAALEAARFEASQLPDAQRKQYEPPLVAALLQARRQEGLA